MSRIGKKPIDIPSGVTVTISPDNVVEVKGPKGTLTQAIDPHMEISQEDGQIIIQRSDDKKKTRASHGLSRSLVANMVEGVANGYQKELEIVGTGYRAAKNGNKLSLTLGFSHPLELDAPEGITVEVPSANKITIFGADKQKVGAYAAYVRSFRSPEPYKGKGVKYVDEHIRRKVGKTGK
ncbi:50S ribosomal protein L6 [Urinicoccus massiliensis]|uniref:50S ribosomal protein L6 n=1 Tax=Urinicoccus massiliensis TaxID=1723382 RepID=UPI000931C138|nr:50S ribosomal protein L6 [Urinicoccus massiliensis]